MQNNTVQINGIMDFYVDDSKMNQLMSLLKEIGQPSVECPECGEDIWPQVESIYYAQNVKEFHVICGACDADIIIRPITFDT